MKHHYNMTIAFSIVGLIALSIILFFAFRKTKNTTLGSAPMPLKYPKECINACGENNISCQQICNNCHNICHDQFTDPSIREQCRTQCIEGSS